MIEKYKYVIKNKKSNSFLSPYNHGEHWVNLENAQFFDIETGREQPVDLVDPAWLLDETVELKKVKLTINVEEVLEESNKKKEYIIDKNKFIELQKMFKLYYNNNDYNEHGTKIKKISILEHIVYNLIRDEFYLKGIMLSKHKFFTTSENINKAKDLIYDYQNNKELFNTKFNGLLTKKELEIISKKLKKQIEE